MKFSVRCYYVSVSYDKFIKRSSVGFVSDRRGNNYLKGKGSPDADRGAFFFACFWGYPGLGKRRSGIGQSSAKER
jgi:hypothetical protein